MGRSICESAGLGVDLKENIHGQSLGGNDYRRINRYPGLKDKMKYAWTNMSRNEDKDDNKFPVDALRGASRAMTTFSIKALISRRDTNGRKFSVEGQLQD